MTPEPTSWKRQAAMAGGIAALTAIAFARTVTFDFVNYDDNLYVTGNSIVAQGLNAETFGWVWTAFVGVQWYPLTLLSHLADVSLYGMDPAGHHATNVLLHALTAGTLFLALVRLTGRAGRSACVALLFALHPLRVESVAWVAERKDVLSGLFWMLALLAYAGYARRPGLGRYGLVLLAFAGGLMSKPMVVTLPFVLLLLDWWPLGRVPGQGSAKARTIGMLVLEKVPLLAMSIAAAAMTVYTQAMGGAVESLDRLPLTDRVMTALGGYWIYAQQLVVPRNLSVFYPMPEAGALYSRAAFGAVLIAGVTAGAWRLRARHPAVCMGWLWYLGVLAPVIGIVQVGAQYHADRYTYLPHIGLLIAGVWAVSDVFAHVPRRAWIGAAAAASVVLGGLTWKQLGYWRSSETLFARALAVTTDNARAHDYYGLALLNGGKALDAIPEFEAAIRLEGGNPQQWLNLATAFERSGDSAKAMAVMRETVKEFPEDASALFWIGTRLLTDGQAQEAAEFLQRAARAAPDRPDVRVNLGIAYGQLGWRAEAEAEFRAAIAANRWYAPAYVNLGVLLLEAGDREGARDQFERALALNPDHELARTALATLDSQQP